MSECDRKDAMSECDRKDAMSECAVKKLTFAIIDNKWINNTVFMFIESPL